MFLNFIGGVMNNKLSRLSKNYKKLINKKLKNLYNDRLNTNKHALTTIINKRNNNLSYFIGVTYLSK